MKVLFQNVVPLKWGAALLRSFLFVGVMTLVFGVVYPAAVTGVSLIFSGARSGSVIEVDGKSVASALIGQDFQTTDLFAGRRSAAATPYDATVSCASNLAPANPRFKKEVAESIAAWQKRTGESSLPPADLVTSSGSGLDPHISEAAALWQVSYVARNTGLTVQELKNLIAQESDVGLFSGRRFVNVVRLNYRVAALRRIPSGEKK